MCSKNYSTFYWMYYIHTGYVEPGYCRELVVHLLLMIAWDQATGMKDFLTSHFGQDNYNNNIQASTKTVICKHNQAGVDLVLPVLLDWDGSNTISLDSMSYFQIQIKNWNQFHDDYDWTASATSKLSKEHAFKGRITGKNRNPYLSLYFQLDAPIPEL
ncbi:5619_t:CDS:2 [Entrophospora sp. SA101]|nr:9545_t:CDS:2 [Entrophospora sp. SA101]CAJ0889014.1 5619_t:CDS:2 [Entrophospora sp. SA101]